MVNIMIFVKNNFSLKVHFIYLRYLIPFNKNVLNSLIHGSKITKLPTNYYYFFLHMNELNLCKNK